MEALEVGRDGVERKLAAILSADVVGYSRLMAEDEDGTVRRLTDYREEIAMLVRQHRGRVVDSPGDNLLVEFPAATEAVSCSMEVQSVLGVRNAALPADRRMEFRIGIHLGEVRIEGDRIYGDGVNIAARLESLAEPGGICLSGVVHSQVRNKLDLGYEDLGEQEFKNIPDPVHVYRVRSRPERRSVFYRFGEFQVDDTLYELRRGGERVELQPKVFDLLLYLIRERGRVVSKSELLDKVWSGVIVNEEALTRAVHEARAALGDTGKSQRVIETVRRRGFRFVAPVEESGLPSPVVPTSTVQVTTREGGRPGAAPVADRQGRAVPPDSLLIAPFRTLSPNADDVFFVRGIAEDLATLLSRFPEFDVIPRYNAHEDSEEALDPLKVGRALSARYLLSGSLRRLGSKIRITIALLDGDTGTQVWGESYDRESAELFQIQDEIVEGIATALGSQLWYAAVAPLVQARPDSLDAWALVQRAVATMNQSHTRESLAETEQLLRRALTIEPGYPLALATLSQVLGNKVRGLFSEAPETDRAEALQLIGEAGREVTQEPRVVYRCGGAYLRLGQPALALGLLERATTLDRSWASARADLGMALIQLGRVSEGIDILRDLVSASRFDPMLWNFRLQLGIGLMLLGDFPGAEDQVRRSIDQLSHFHWSWIVLGLILGGQQKLDQARESIATARKLEPSIRRERYESVLLEVIPEQTSNAVIELFRTLWP